MTFKDTYTKLYADKSLHYGSAAHNRCPGVRYLPKYSHWLQGSILDLGCGNGDTVTLLRSKGFDAYGLDQIPPTKPYCYEGDITERVAAYGTVICIDVLEHIPDSSVGWLLKNIGAAEHNVVTIHNGPSFERGCDMDLHVNKKPAEEWQKVFEEHWKVNEILTLAPHRFMFLGEKR